MAHLIYAAEMTATFVDCGYPLWDPDCEVSIADVGYIRHGQFCRLFNASKPKGDPDNQAFGEPDGYEPFVVGAIQERTPHPPGIMASRSVRKMGADVDFSGSILEAGAGFQFECKKDRGAILIINSQACRQDALRMRAFKDYLLKHYKSWLRLANNPHNAREITESDLVFVTGRDNTADWATATFTEQSLSGGVSFQAGYPALAGARFSIWGSWKQASSIQSHCGPRIPRVSRATSDIGFAGDVSAPVCAAELDKYNQCIFLRGLRVLERGEYARRKLSLKASNSSDGLTEIRTPWFSRSSSSLNSSTSSLNKGGSSSEGGSQSRQNSLLVTSPTDDNQVGMLGMGSNFQQVRAPIDSLLEYILEMSEADIAVAHDHDLSKILKKTDEEEVTDFNNLIRSASIPVYVDSQGVGTSQHYEDLVDISQQYEDLVDTAQQYEDPVDTAQQYKNPVDSIQQYDPPSGSQIQPTVEGERSQTPKPSRSPFDDSGRCTPTASQVGTPRVRRPELPPEKKFFWQVNPVPEAAVPTPKAPSSQSSTRKPRAPRDPGDAAYYAEQDRIRADIDVLQARLRVVQDRISLTTKTGRVAERRDVLRAELDVLRDRQRMQRMERDAASAELKALQEQVRQKVKDLQTIVKKLPARTTEEVDGQIRTLERRVETSALTLSEERETLRQIGLLRRSRKAVENSQALQADIDAHRTHADALQKRMSSESIATATRMDTVREELETMRRESDAAFLERGELYSERAQLQTQLSALHDHRRQAVERFKAEREERRRMADEQRAQNAARARAERAAREEQQRIQAQERLLEKARTPAFTAEIRDCRSLLEYFSGARKGESASSSSSSAPSISEGPHRLRQPVENYPEAYPLAGSVPLKKKGEEEDVYFVGGKGKRKKGHRKGPASSTTGSAKVSVPLGILSTLVSLSIDPPNVTADLPRTIEELHKKIKWYEVNQARVTEENVARTRADFLSQRLYPSTPVSLTT